MENEQIKQYLISFVEKTLNKCKTFTSVYGKDFIRQRLSINLIKVYTDIYHDVDNGQYSLNDSSIRLFSHNANTDPLTIKDIENDYVYQHDILHEAIHAIFRRLPDECESLGIEDGTGIDEYGNNGMHLGRGFNEGLTEWICKKAGYPLNVYEVESSIVEMFDLAIGEENVIKLAKGGIKENATELLQMSKQDVVSFLSGIDEIWSKENDIYQLERIINKLSNRDNLPIGNQEQLKNELGADYDKYSDLLQNMAYFAKGINISNLHEQVSYLNRALSYEKNDLAAKIAFTKEDIYLKYFAKEIEELVNSTTISKEAITRLTALYNDISEECTSYSPVLLKFKNEIYPELLEKSPLVSESKFAEIYKKSKGSINQVLGKIKMFFKEKIVDKNKENNDIGAR